MHPGGTALVHHVGNLIADANTAQREIAGSDGLGKLNEVGLNAPVLEAKHFSGSAKAGDHLVRYQQHIILIANLPDAGKIIILRNDNTAGTLNRFGNKHGHCIGAFLQNFLLKFIGGRNALAFGVLGCLVQIGIRARDMNKPRYPRLKHRPVGCYPGRTHCRKRHTVIAPDSGYDFCFFRFSLNLPVIAGHFDIAVRGFSAARGQVEVIDIRIGQSGQPFSEFNRPGVGTAGVTGCKPHLAHLFGSGISQFMAAVARGVVPESGEAVDKAVSVSIDKVSPFTSRPYPGRCVPGGAVQGMHQMGCIPVHQLLLLLCHVDSFCSQFLTGRIRSALYPCVG